MNSPRQYSFVRFNYSAFPENFKNSTRNSYPFAEKKRYIFLGEIPNMPRHCIVTDANGKMYAGYRIEDFVELTEDELGDYQP